MKINIFREKISAVEFKRIADETFGEMAKAVVDVRLGILAVGGELHADAEALLLDNGSVQEDLWGINIYVDKPKDRRVEFSSFINIRPSQGNRSMDIQDERLKMKILEIMEKLAE